MNRDQKREIAECFKKHFNHFGYRKTSVDDIAKELKISKKTIYRFFSSKEKIFHFILSRIAKKFCDEMEREISQKDRAIEKINELIRLIFFESKKWLKTNDAFEFKYKYEIAGMAFKEAYRELLIKLLSDGVEAGELDISNVEITTQFIMGIISESMKLVTANPDLEIESQVIDSINKLVG